jgi:hypothetical protein
MHIRLLSQPIGYLHEGIRDINHGAIMIDRPCIAIVYQNSMLHVRSNAEFHRIVWHLTNSTVIRTHSLTENPISIYHSVYQHWALTSLAI